MTQVGKPLATRKSDGYFAVFQRHHYTIHIEEGQNTFIGSREKVAFIISLWCSSGFSHRNRDNCILYRPEEFEKFLRHSQIAYQIHNDKIFIFLDHLVVGPLE